MVTSALFRDVSMPRSGHSYMVPAPPESFGDILRRMRLERGWSQWHVAHLIEDITGERTEQGMISSYETGKVKQPFADTLAALDDVFGQPRGFFAGHVYGLAAAARVKELPPPPDSIVVPPADGDMYRVVKWLQDLPDSAFDNMVVISGIADPAILDDVVRTVKLKNKPFPKSGIIEVPEQKRKEDRA